MKNLNGKAQKVAKKKKIKEREGELANFSEPSSQQNPNSWVRDKVVAAEE